MARHPAARTRTPTNLLLTLLLVAGAALAATPAHGAPSSSLTRYPYLTDLAGGSVTVNWATTRTATTASVTIGTVGTEPACASRTVAATRTSITVKSVSQYQWKATVPDLEPDATYCYRVHLGTSPKVDLLGSDPSPRFRSELGARPTAPFSFAVFGDWGQANAGSANPSQEALLGLLAKSDARFAVGTGDVANPSGSQSNYGDLYQAAASAASSAPGSGPSPGGRCRTSRPPATTTRTAPSWSTGPSRGPWRPRAAATSWTPTAA